jgi:hypothetical protein
MRQRLVLAAASLAALALAAPAAMASPTPVLDGKKVTKLTASFAGGLQDNDADTANLGADRADCKAPRCGVLKFVFKPAKGVQADALFTIKWTNPASDIDLYVAEVGKDGTMTGLAQCGGIGNTSETVFAPAGTFKVGKTYALVADFFRSVNETINGTVTMPAPAPAAPVPAAADGLVYPINCTL